MGPIRCNMKKPARRNQHRPRCRRCKRIAVAGHRYCRQHGHRPENHVSADAVDDSLTGLIEGLIIPLARGLQRIQPNATAPPMLEALMLRCRLCGKPFRSGPWDEIDKANTIRFDAGQSDCDPRLCEPCCHSQQSRRASDDKKTIELNKSDYVIE